MWKQLKNERTLECSEAREQNYVFFLIVLSKALANP